MALANISKIIALLNILLKLLRLSVKHKLLSLVVIMALSLITLSSYLIAEFYNKNAPYVYQVKIDNYIKYIDDILIKYGDKTAISVSVIDTDELLNNKFRLGRFEIARACDDRAINTKCIVNLKDRLPSVYSVDHKIDSSSYGFLLEIGKKVLPAHFHTRDDNGEQDFSAMVFYPSLMNVASKLHWFEQKIINDIWITSILSDDKTVLYVITLLSAKDFRESVYISHDSILIGIRQFITNQDK